MKQKESSLDTSYFIETSRMWTESELKRLIAEEVRKHLPSFINDLNSRLA